MDLQGTNGPEKTHVALTVAKLETAMSGGSLKFDAPGVLPTTHAAPAAAAARVELAGPGAGKGGGESPDELHMPPRRLNTFTAAGGMNITIKVRRRAGRLLRSLGEAGGADRSSGSGPHAAAPAAGSDSNPAAQSAPKVTLLCE
jgi:hypothetical protein